MNDPYPISRRKYLSVLCTLAAYLTAPGRLVVGKPLDQGIGGTGIVLPPKEDEPDQGIGGTGVIGTIRRFGSIFVNGLRISYPQDVIIKIDGEAAPASALRLGQVVRVIAHRNHNGWSTHQINVTSEVVGPVEKISRNRLQVLGQQVSTTVLRPAARWRIGDHVAVSGLRLPGGTIAASLIEGRPPGALRVAGRLDKEADGSFKIGNLSLTGVNSNLLGHRVVLQGSLLAGSMVVTSFATEHELLGPNVKRLVVEAYVERRGEALLSGSGLRINSRATNLNQAVSVSGTGHVVLTTSIDRSGNFGLQSIRPALPASGDGHDGSHFEVPPSKTGPGPAPGRTPHSGTTDPFGGPSGGNGPFQGGSPNGAPAGPGPTPPPNGFGGGNPLGSPPGGFGGPPGGFGRGGKR
jgi:hypothetical protein